MPRYIIERDIEDGKKLTGLDLQEISSRSCAAIRELGPGITWIHSYVTGNKIYCVYEAENEEIIRKCSELAGLPVTKILQVETIIDPSTAG